MKSLKILKQQTKDILLRVIVMSWYEADYLPQAKSFIWFIISKQL